MNTNAEEYGLYGAEHYALRCKNEEKNILGVFNLDMIGYNPIDMPLAIFYNDKPPVTEKFAKYFSRVSNLYLPEIPALPYIPDPRYGDGKSGNGDAMWFIYYDYPAMYMGDILGTNYGCGYEGYFQNPCYHSGCDTIGIGKSDAGVNSMELVKAYTQATLVAIAELAEWTGIYVEKELPIIYPNPTGGSATLTLYLNDAGHLSVTLNDILGQEVMEIHNAFLDEKIFVKTFSLSNLARGMYFLKIIHNGNVRVEKIIKN